MKKTEGIQTFKIRYSDDGKLYRQNSDGTEVEFECGFDPIFEETVLPNLNKDLGKEGIKVTRATQHGYIMTRVDAETDVNSNRLESVPKVLKPIVEPLDHVSDICISCKYCAQKSQLDNDDFMKCTSFDETVTMYSHWEENETFRKQQNNFKKSKQLKSMEKLLTEVREHNDDWRSDMEQATTNTPISIQDISRAPIQCPHCGNVMSPTSIMMHFATQHLRTGDTFFVEMFLNQRCVHTFEPLKLIKNQKQVITMFAYGGTQNQLDSKPIRRGYALPNMRLCEEFAPYLQHSPILLVICRTSMLALLGDQAVIDKFEPSGSDIMDSNDVWIIWLTAAKMLKPLYGTITVYNHKKLNSCSSIVRVRNIAESQNCEDFLAEDVNHLMVSMDTLRSLTHDLKKPINLEIVFNEYDCFDN